MSTSELKNIANHELKAIRSEHLTPSERAELVTSFIKSEEANILQRHREGAGGLEIAAARSALLVPCSK